MSYFSVTSTDNIHLNTLILSSSNYKQCLNTSGTRPNHSTDKKNKNKTDAFYLMSERNKKKQDRNNNNKVCSEGFDLSRETSVLHW